MSGASLMLGRCTLDSDAWPRALDAGQRTLDAGPSMCLL